MKEKILSAIKAAISVGGKTSISDKTLSAYVDAVAGQITDESQIATAIAPHVAVLKEVQANINSVAAAAARVKDTEWAAKVEEAKRAAATPPVPPLTPPTPSTQGGDEITRLQETLAKVLEGQQTLAKSVESIVAEKTQTTLSQKLTETLQSKNVPDCFYTPAVTGRTFKDENEVTVFADGLATQWETAKQTLANQGFQETAPPQQGKPTPNTDGEAFAKQIDAGTKALIDSKKQVNG